jgi:hypothetical protein
MYGLVIQGGASDSTLRMIYGVQMSTVTINLLVGLFGTLSGGFVTWHIQRRESRVSVILEMHREFNSVGMVATRYRAAELLQGNPCEDFAQLNLRLGTSAMRDVWSVQYFYQRL